MEYLIRPSEKKDLPKLVELCAKHASYESAEYDYTGKSKALEGALFVDNPKLFCFVIESHLQVKGYFSYTYDFSTWDAQWYMHLDCLYLEPELRGQKIGDSIIKKLKEIAHQHKCVNIQWQTPVNNSNAIRFYHRMGASGKEKIRFFLNI